MQSNQQQIESNIEKIPPILKLSELENDALIWYNSLEVFNRTFFPSRFSKPFTPLHRRMMAPLDDKNLTKVAYDAFRGCGKTSLVALGLAAQGILFRMYRFIIYITETETVAIEQTENLRRELMTNYEVRQVFGSIRTKTEDDIGERFGKKGWVAQLPDEGSGRQFKTFILPRGSGQQVRGLLYEDARPDLILIDDLEDKETISNPEVRRKRKIWLYGDVLKCVSRITKHHRFIYTDTVKHEDSLLLSIKSLPDWYSDSIAICDENLNSLCPEYMTTDEIKAEYEEHRKLSITHVFAQEYMGKIIASEDAPFKQEMFQYYSEATKEFNATKDRMVSVLLYDPARTINPKSAESGFAIWGVDIMTGKLYFRFGMGEKLDPGEQHEMVVTLCKRFGVSVLGVEPAGLEDHIMQPLETKLRESNLFLSVIKLKPKRVQNSDTSGIEGAKAARITSLLSFYRQKRIWHNEDGCQKYEQQLLSLPYAAKWDVMDAAAYIVQVLADGHVILSQAASKESEEEAWRELKREYAQMGDGDFERTYII